MPDAEIQKTEYTALSSTFTELTEFLKCDSCYMADRGCPKKKAKGTCTIQWEEIFALHSPETALNFAIQDLVRLQYGRIKRAVAAEAASGGLIDKTVTEQFNSFFKMLSSIKKLSMDEEFVFIKSSSSKRKGSGEGGMLKKLLDNS